MEKLRDECRAMEGRRNEEVKKLKEVKKEYINKNNEYIK
jgi:hypothetical protein